MPNISDKTPYILLHGAWHGGWCWQRIVPALVKRGHQVMAPDLPGHGEDKTPFANITLQTYVDFVSDLVNSQPGRVILVGHSMAGVVISQVAENLPEKVAQLVYVAAFVPDNTESLLQTAKKSQSPGVSTEMILDKTNNRVGLKRSRRIIELFYNTCGEADANYALERLRDEPGQTFLDSVTYSEARFGKVAKRYVACLQDRVIPIEDQRRMYLPITTDVIELDSDHSPFFSAAEELVEALCPTVPSL